MNTAGLLSADISAVARLLQALHAPVNTAGLRSARISLSPKNTKMSEYTRGNGKQSKKNKLAGVPPAFLFDASPLRGGEKNGR